MFKATVIGLVLVCVAVLSFASPVRSPLVTTEQTDSFPTAQIIDKVNCVDDPTRSYALYLPSHYTPDKRWPILYALDPGARGKVPVETFKAAAEEFGWIIVGSNNSRNGPADQAGAAWNAMWKDTHKRLAIDEGRAYAAGFSGGARLAVSIARACDCLAGVVVSGAGFPAGLAPSASLRFPIFATVGMEDFNFPEVKGLDDDLAKAGVAHHLEVFAGAHEWLPPELATEAIEWFELEAMKTGKRARDASLIDSVWERKTQQAKALAASKDQMKHLEAYQIYTQMSATFDSLRDVSQIKNQALELSRTTEVKNALRAEREEMRKQREIEGPLYSLLAAEQQVTDNLASRSQLRTLVANVRKSASAAADSNERRVARRVMSGLSVALFEQGTRQLESEKRYAAAATTFALGAEMFPQRAGWDFYYASALALAGEKKKSLQALQNAIAKGFADLAAVTDNKSFDSLRNEPAYLQIVETLKAKAKPD